MTPSTASPRRRGIFAAISALAVAASVLVAVPANATSVRSTDVSASSTSSAGIVPAADLSSFTPGNLIADSVFFNSGTLSANQIDTFFRSKVSACRSGYVCLKDYRQNTPNRPADAYCKGYSGAANESAATIISRVAASCGINPQVLIVMLEKEQSLVTHTWPSNWRYDMALGQGCPDTAPCDPAYAGFFYQIYGAARQMQIYAEGRWFTYYAPGKTWNILYHPNKACGTSPVYVQNTATAALYYYTPYQPNRAALNAGYGTGDSCSSYGNRNFFQLFSDWFGDPRRDANAVSGVIADVWNSNGAASGWIGAPTSSMRSWAFGPGWSQQFANADIYVKSGSPGRTVTGSIRIEYRLVGEVSSGLGWPLTDRVAISGGAYQDFEGGRIYERSDGRAFAVASPMYAAHEALGNVFGAFGWPTSRAYTSTGGAVQTFDGGALYQSSAGVAALNSAWVSWLTGVGGPAGDFGFPLSSPTSAGAQDERLILSKSVVYRQSAKTVSVFEPMLATYAAGGYEAGALKKPVGAAYAISGGRYQDFAGGRIFSSAQGTFAVTSFASEMESVGGVSRTGFPAGNEVVSGSASSQRFTSLTLTKGASGSQKVSGAIRTRYDNAGGAASFLGAAKGAERSMADGFTQEFDGGRVVCSTVAVVALTSAMSAAWDKLGAQGGRLGWPTGEATSIAGVTQQSFQGGLLITNSKGVTYPVFGTMLSTLRTAGGAAVLGGPLEAEQSSTAGYSQRFEKGVVFVPFVGSASAVALETFAEYVRGGEQSGFGFATGIASPVGVGKAQPFQLGSIATSGNGTYAVRGTMWRVFVASGGYMGPLGFPVESESQYKDGYLQPFTGGTAYVSPYGLAVTRGVLEREYSKRGGVTGSLGWPLGNETSGDGVWQQRFQNGTIYLYANGTVVVR